MIRLMTLYKSGDVILIPFPFTDFSTFKNRPALIISSTNFNRRSGDVFIAAISSNLRVRGRYDYKLNQKGQDTAGLPLPSVIKLGKILTIDQRLIRKRIGYLPNEVAKKIIKEICKILS